jgi:flagellar basal body P-ring protein FlgI
MKYTFWERRLVAAYLEIDESKALDELLSEAGISIAPAERTTASTQTVEFLKEIENLPINQPEGGVRIIVQGKHINLRAVLWEIAASSLALLPKALDPTGISQVVGAAAFGTALIKLKDRITSLTDFQLVVCNAVAKITRQKSEGGRVFVEPGASAEEVMQELRRQTGQAAPNIPSILKNLCPKVLAETFYEASGPFYKLVP